MHQNSPTAIADLKKFPGGETPGPPFLRGATTRRKGGGTGWEVGRGEGREEGGRGRRGELEAPFVKS